MTHTAHDSERTPCTVSRGLLPAMAKRCNGARPGHGTGRTGARRTLRGIALSLVALCALWMALPAPAQAQTLVSNIGQTSNSSRGLAVDNVAQAFTTGPESGGYTLTSVVLRLQTQANPTLPDVTVRRGSPTGDAIATFT